MRIHFRNDNKGTQATEAFSSPKKEIGKKLNRKIRKIIFSK
jgi:hypothetical protein